MFVATACSVQLLLELVVPDGADVTEKGLCATSLTTRNISLGCQIPIGLPSTLPSTSGWVFRFCTAGASWGSNNQKSVALSSCEAEIVASSEAAMCQRRRIPGAGPETFPRRTRAEMHPGGAKLSRPVVTTRLPLFLLTILRTMTQSQTCRTSPFLLL